jgi:hypothetical protein
MHSAERAMFPIATAALSFREISDYWSRVISPPASSNELLNILVSAWWLGELRGDSVNSRLELLKIMFTSMYRDDLGIIFIVGDDAGPPEIELPDGFSIVDVRPQIRVPSSNIESWDEAACTKPFHALAEVTKESSIKRYQEFAVLLPSIKLTYEEFNIWHTSRGYSPQTFWQHPDQAHRHHGGAASSAGSDDDAPHLGRVTSQKERKTWQTGPGCVLSKAENAVLKAINEIWPNGIIDHNAKARNERILSQLKIAQQHVVSPRTIQRTLTKIHFV